MPDGTVIEGVPDTATKADVMAKYQAKTQPAPRYGPDKYGIGEYDRTFGPAVVRGFRDTVQGLMQLGAAAGNKVGLVSDQSVTDLNKYVDDSLKSYEAEHGGKPGSTTGRVLGGIVATGPVNAIVPGGGSASKVVQTLSNVVKGSTVGATQATGEGDSRALNTAVGAGVGGFAPYIAKLLSAPASWVMRKAGIGEPVGVVGSDTFTRQEPRMGSQSSPELTPQVQAELRQAGIDWNTLGDSVKKQFYDDAMKATNAVALKPAEQLRLSQANTLPVKVPMSQGNLTQDFAQNQFEAETAKNALAGKPLQDLQTAQSAAFRDNFKALQTRIAPAPDSEQASGKSVVSALEKGRASLKGVVDQAYQAAREDPAIGNQVSMGPVQEWLATNKPVFGTVKELGSAQAELKRLGAFGKDAQPLTVENVEQYRQFLNTLRQSPDARVQKFVGDLIDKVDESVLSSGNSDLFKNARFAAALKNATYKDQGIVDSLLKMTSRTDRSIAYEDVWKTSVVNSDINSLKQLKNTLMVGPKKVEAAGGAAWKDLQGQTVQYLEDAAKSASVGENGMPIFNANKFDKALRTIGNEKLQILFGKEAETLYTLRDVMKTTMRPDGTVNRSNTASALGNMVQKTLGSLGGTIAGSLTGAGPMGAMAGAAMGPGAVNAVKNAGIAAQANKAANPVKTLSSENVPPLMRLSDLLRAPLAQPSAVGATQSIRSH